VRVRNYTGHPLTITVGNKSVTVKSEGRARIDSGIEEVGTIEFEGLEVPLIELREKQILGLPEPEDDVIYVVSGIVATAAQRVDVVAPSRVSREEKTGRVRECKAFVQPRPIDKES